METAVCPTHFCYWSFCSGRKQFCECVWRVNLHARGGLYECRNVLLRYLLSKRPFACVQRVWLNDSLSFWVEVPGFLGRLQPKTKQDCAAKALPFLFQGGPLCSEVPLSHLLIVFSFYLFFFLTFLILSLFASLRIQMTNLIFPSSIQLPLVLSYFYQ